MPLSALPVNASTGALDLSRYDMRLPAGQRAALPLTKLVDDFRAAFGVVASQGPLWTIQTTLNAPRSRRARRPRLPAPRQSSGALCRAARRERRRCTDCARRRGLRG
jgi:hypothetical protein